MSHAEPMTFQKLYSRLCLEILTSQNILSAGANSYSEVNLSISLNVILRPIFTKTQGRSRIWVLGAGRRRRREFGEKWVWGGIVPLLIGVRSGEGAVLSPTNFSRDYVIGGFVSTPVATALLP